MDVWILFAFLQSLAGIGAYLIADFTRVRSFDLMFWNRIFGCVMLSPILLFIPPPTSASFYVLCLFTAAIYAIYDLVFLDMASQKGAGLPTRIAPLSAWATFILWLFINPSLMMKYIDNPLASFGIISSAVLCGYFALRLRKCLLTWEAMKKALPFIGLSALGAVFSKSAIDQTNMISGTFYYLFMQAALVGAIYMFMKLFMPNTTSQYASGENIVRREFILAGFLSALCFISFGIFKISAFWSVENPAYVSVFGLLAPFWVFILKKILGKEEQGDILSGFGIVVGCICLVICVNFL